MDGAGDNNGLKGGRALNRNVLVVDDEPLVLQFLRRCLQQDGYRVFVAHDAIEGLELITRFDIAVVISDQSMPIMDGITFLAEVRNIKPHIIRVMITAYGDLDHARKAIFQSQIFAYLTKPCQVTELRETVSAAFRRFDDDADKLARQEEMAARAFWLEQQVDDLKGAIDAKNLEMMGMLRSGVMTLALLAEARDDCTGHHVKRIGTLTRTLCLQMGMGQNEAERHFYFSMMHDVGKIHIPDAILKKPGRLSADEWMVMKSHTVEGERLLKSERRFKLAWQIARSHHERWDGSGYPDGLVGESIPLAARIVTICDVFDALVNERPYKRAWSREEAFEEMEHQREKLFDPRLLTLFFQMFNGLDGNLPLGLADCRH